MLLVAGWLELWRFRWGRVRKDALLWEGESKPEFSNRNISPLFLFKGTLRFPSETPRS